MPRGILFDFNGVIVNDEPQHCAALIATLAEYGVELDEAGYYRDYLGFDDRECFRYSFERIGRGGDAALVDEAIEKKAIHYREAIDRSMELVPGAADFVREAAAGGLRLGIVSGALRREIDLVLDRGGLLPYFHAVVAAEDVGACKPDPEGYRLGLSALGLHPASAVVVEDSLPGLAAARAAGLRCAMLSTSHPPTELGGADLVWDDLMGRHPRDLPWLDD